MKRFNALYVGLMSFFVVFGVRGMDISVLANPRWEPKTTEEKVVTDISAFIQKPQIYLLYGLSHSITQQPILEKIQLFISRDDSPENINWSNRIISSYSNAPTITPETIDDFKKLRLAIIGSANTPLLCNELKNIFSQSKIEDESYTRELIDILKEKKKSKKLKDSLDSLVSHMQDKIITPHFIPHFKPDFDGAKVILSIICDATYFDRYPRQINTIIDSQDSNKQKRQNLSRLYDELESLQKTVGTNPKATSNILDQKLFIKKAYKTLQNVPAPLADLPATQDLFSQSSLNWNDTFNDLNASYILSDNDLQDLDKQQAFETFEKATQSFLSTINSLQNQPKKSNYNEIIQSLDTMIAFIYKHDLSAQKQNAPYTAYRCWLLELIKKTIETHNSFSEEMISDWKNEVSAVAEVTKQRFQSTDGNLDETKIQVETLIAAKKKAPGKTKGVPFTISAPIALSPEEMQKKEAIKASISEMEKQFGPNAFNATFLSNFLTELKNYKKMLLSKEKKEQVRIAHLIKDTAKKIKKIAVIKPRPESKKKIITEKLHNISHSISSESSSIDIEKAIASLEIFLPVGDYNTIEAIDKKDAQLYSLLLATLNKCVQSLLVSETKRLNENSELGLSYFKRMSYQISLFKSLQEATSNDTRLTLIIKSYYQIINLGINSLIKQIKTPDSWLNKSADMRTNMINQYLGNDVILQPYLEQVNAAIQQQKQQEIPQIPIMPNPSGQLPLESNVAQQPYDIPEDFLRGMIFEVELLPYSIANTPLTDTFDKIDQAIATKNEAALKKIVADFQTSIGTNIYSFYESESLLKLDKASALKQAIMRHYEKMHPKSQISEIRSKSPLSVIIQSMSFYLDQLYKNQLISDTNAIAADKNNIDIIFDYVQIKKQTPNLKLFKTIVSSEQILNPNRIQACLLLLNQDGGFYPNMNTNLINNIIDNIASDYLSKSLQNDFEGKKNPIIASAIERLNFLPLLQKIILNPQSISEISDVDLEDYSENLQQILSNIKLEKSVSDKLNGILNNIVAEGSKRLNAQPTPTTANAKPEQTDESKQPEANEIAIETQPASGEELQTPSATLPTIPQIPMPLNPEPAPGPTPVIPTDLEQSIRPTKTLNLLEEQDDATEDLRKLNWDALAKKLTKITDVIPNQPVDQLKKTIKDLQGYLPTTSTDASRIAIQGKSDIYNNVIQTLYKCIQELAEKEKLALQQQTTIDTNYFKNISDQIQLFESLLSIEQNQENLKLINNIINLYHRMINTGIQLLKEKIREIKDISERKNTIDSYLGNNDTLKPYLLKEFYEKATATLIDDYRKTAHELIAKDYSSSSLKELQSDFNDLFTIKNSKEVDDLRSEVQATMKKITTQFLDKTKLEENKSIPIEYFQQLGQTITSLQQHIYSDVDNEIVQLYWDKLSNDINLLIGQIKNKRGAFESLNKQSEVEQKVRQYLDDTSEILKPFLTRVLSEIKDNTLEEPQSSWRIVRAASSVWNGVISLWNSFWSYFEHISG